MVVSPDHSTAMDALFTTYQRAAIVWAVGGVLFVVGWFGYHWIQRRRFYRRKLADPFPSYTRYWLVTRSESVLVLGFVGAIFMGLLCLLTGAVDIIDGPNI